MTENLKPHSVGAPRRIRAATGSGHLGMVGKAHTYDWNEIKALLAEPMQSCIDHATYTAASKAERNAWKKGDPFILFGKCRDQKRDDEHLVARSALSFDFDMEAQNLFFEFLILGTVFGDFAYLWHTTRSHTNGEPRLRVYVLLSRDVTPDEYRTLCPIVARLFGSLLDPASVKPAQMMFLPVQNKGADYHFDFHEGSGYLNPDFYLDQVVPMAALEKDKAAVDENDPLANAKPPVAGWSIERVNTELLAYLSSDMGHDDWVKIGLALHHQFGGSDEALTLWDDWSRQGTHDRYQEGECARRWSSFKAQRPQGRGPVTLLSLMAKVDLVKSETHKQEIGRLAALGPVAYDLERKAAADRLGVRVVVLDHVVDEAKAANAAEDLPACLRVVEPWHEIVDGAELLSKVAGTVQQFIVCAVETAHACALWIAMTWLMDAVKVAPIATITAPEKRCGKSLLLSLMAKLARRPLAASNTSPAALFRAIEAWKPTFLIDEADAFLRENEELRGLLNCGHTRETAYVVRTVGDDHTPKLFNAWGAKAIAGIGRLADTLMDRSIVLELRRKLSHEQVEKLRHADPAIFQTLEAKLARWALDNADAVRAARPAVPGSLHDRAADNWEPLMQIAEVAGGPWPDLATRAALKLSGGSEQAQSTGAELLADIQAFFETKGVQRVSTVDLLSALLSDDEKPWATCRRGKAMNARSLGEMLSGYSIASKSLRIDGEPPCKGFERKQFHDAFERYLHAPTDNPSHPVIEVQASTGAGLAITGPDSVTDTQTGSVTLQPALDKACNGVTEKPGEVRRADGPVTATFLD